MLNNLKLGSETATTHLTPADTNITADWDLPQIDNSLATAYDAPRIYAYSPQSSDLDDPTFYGYHYNWCAVTAGDPATCVGETASAADASQDICPANWRLPLGGQMHLPGSEFVNLVAVLAGYPGNTDSNFLADFNGRTAFSAQIISPGVFRGNYAGAMWGNIGLDNSQGSSGYWWTSSTWYNNAVFSMSIRTPNRVDITGAYDRNNEFSVRCLAQAGTTDTNSYSPKPTVTIDGTAIDPMDVRVISDTELRIKMPAHAAGMVDVVVGIDGETQTVQYEYVDDSTGPYEPTPNPSPTPTPNPGGEGGNGGDNNSGGGSGSGGNQGGNGGGNGGNNQSGQATSAPECTANAPSAPAPYLYQATAGDKQGSINLHFQTGEEPFDQYLLEYGYLNQNFSFGAIIENPKAGIFTINDLTPGQIYQFRLTPLNGCAAGPVSNTFPVSVGLPKVPGLPNTGFRPTRSNHGN
jgi:uncharacterized protein (TIGR02145 family)